MKPSRKQVVAWIVLTLSGASPAFAAGSFAEQCPDIPVCAKVVGEMLGQKYVFDADVKGRVLATGNLELTKDNAELLFTDMLNLNGFSRVPLGQGGTFQIMRQRDARDSAIPTVTADKGTPPELPNNWDMVTMKYKATHPDVAEHIARMSRSFMPGNSRIISDEVGGLVLVTDSAINLKKLYGIIRDLDQKPTAEMKKRWHEEEVAWRAERLARQQGQTPPQQTQTPPAPAPAAKK